MTPQRSELLIPILVFFSFFIFLKHRELKKSISFITNTWFKKPSKTLYLREILYYLGIFFLLISLLDFRGDEEKLETNIPDQKTIIIIDSSASMLAEDVRPNRFKKSILMARHFIKKAFGHKVAIVLFSDTQKRLVPFTDDLDLLDARVAGLEDLDLYNGGSNISQAIKESLGYFKVDSGRNVGAGGNVLVFTDSEGHDEDFDFNIPGEVSLAVVGAGTLKGARIPHRDRFGVFRGYKKFKNEEVVSRLNEDWLKGLSSSSETYKYWVANSYTIPTEEIMLFFNNKFKERLVKGTATVRPVKAQKILMPAVIFLLLSFLLYPRRSFLALFAFVFINAPGLNAINVDEEYAEELLQKIKEGSSTTEMKVKLADTFLRLGKHAEAEVLYEENYDALKIEGLNNYAINLIKNKKAEDGIKVLSDLQLSLRANSSIENREGKIAEVRQNMILALSEQKKQKQQKKEDQKEEKNKEQKQDEGKNKDDSSEKGGKGDQKKQSGKEDKSKKDDKNKKGKDKDKEKEKDKENDESKSEKNKKKEQKPKSLEDKQSEIEKKRRMVKIPGLIKQIMSDDRNLQKKYLDTSTEKPKAYQKKDW